MSISKQIAIGSSLDVPEESNIQRRQCPKCRQQVSVRSKFCPACGTRIAGLNSTEKVGEDLQPFALESDALSQALQYRKTTFNIADLLPYEIARSPREIYFELGAALLHDQEYDQAIEAFQHALEKRGTTPREADIMLYLAYSQEMVGNKTEAFRQYLAAVLQIPDWSHSVLLHLHDLLPGHIDLDLGKEITIEWAAAIIKKVADSHVLMHVALLLAQVELYLGNYPLTLKHFREAMQRDPHEASALGAALLLPERLPDAFSFPMKEGSGNAEFILAQFYRELGFPQEALHRVNRALGLGMEGLYRYPETPALLLKAQLLEEAGDREGAATRYYEAGRRFSWRNDFTQAVEYLTRAKELNPQQVKTYWYLSNALRLGSYTPGEMPYVNRKGIERSLAIWEEGCRLHLPGVTDSWAYVVRALINQSLVALTRENQLRQNLLWGAIVYLERALLLYEKDVLCWAFLGRYYRILNYEVGALAATQKALECDDSDPTALDERAVILANIGQFREAEKEIDRRRQLEPSLLADGIKAYILVHTKRAQEARDLLDLMIAASPLEISYYGLRALCNQVLGHYADAERDYQFILDHYNESDMNNRSAFGWAAFKLGKIERAIEIFLPLQGDQTQEQCSVLWNLGMFYLTKGDLASAESYLERGTEAASNRRQLDDVLLFDFEELERTSSHWSHGSQAREVMERVRKQIKLRKNQLTHTDAFKADALKEELQQVISQFNASVLEPEENLAWIGAQAGLARFYVENKNWSEAATIYRRLQSYTEQFPEAQRGLEKVSEAQVAQVPQS